MTLAQILQRIFPGPVSLRTKQGGWVALVGVGLSALEANYANNQRKNAQDSSNSYSAKAGQLVDQQVHEGDQLYNRYSTVFQPAQDRFIAAAEQPINPTQEAGRAIGGVQQAADVQTGVARRNMARYGIRPDSGAWMNMERQNALGTSEAEAAAGTNARRYAADETIRRLGLISDLGNNTLGIATGLQRGGINYYSGQANANGQVAAGYGEGVGQGLTGAMYWLNKYKNPNPNQKTSGGT